jgi:methenyltetrahydrofolate cyclohydrolase
VSPARSFEELSIGDLLAALGAQQGAPAGGSAAAVTLAIAAAVVEMAARASGPRWAQAGGAVAQAAALRSRSVQLAELDGAAYDAAVAALRAGGGQDLERALSQAAAVPLQIAHTGADVAQLACEVAEHCEPDLGADAAVAAMLASAATRGAAGLVEVNLGTITGDPRAVEAGALVAQADSAAERASRGT